jgi:hypothetical protein
VGQAAVTPSVVPPAGGEATGRLFVQSPVPLPSGTVVQAKVTEEFELVSGKKASEEVRRQDIRPCVEGTRVRVVDVAGVGEATEVPRCSPGRGPPVLEEPRAPPAGPR